MTFKNKIIIFIVFSYPLFIFFNKLNDHNYIAQINIVIYNKILKQIFKNSFQNSNRIFNNL